MAAVTYVQGWCLFPECRPLSPFASFSKGNTVSSYAFCLNTLLALRPKPIGVKNFSTLAVAFKTERKEQYLQKSDLATASITAHPMQQEDMALRF